MTLVITPGAASLDLRLVDEQGKSVATEHINSAIGRQHITKQVMAFYMKQNIRAGDVKVVAVEAHEASFTHSRQATSIANALRWLTGAKVGEAELFSNGKYSIRVSKRYLAPRYSGKPNITKPKK